MALGLGLAGVRVRPQRRAGLGLGLGHVLELGRVAPQPLHEAVLLQVGVEALALGAVELAPRDRVREVAGLRAAARRHSGQRHSGRQQSSRRGKCRGWAGWAG